MHFLSMLACLTFLSTAAIAAEDATESARKQTEALLLDPSGPATEQAKKITSDPAEQQKINALAADVFNKLVEQSNGDPDKMMQMVDAARRDPASFANSFTPEQRKQLESITSSLGAVSPGSEKPQR